MLLLLRVLCFSFWMLAGILSPATFADNRTNIPVLCYHNFNPTVPGLMNLTPKRFESQIKWLKDNGFTIVPLKEVVEYLQGKRTSLPAKPVVITADDGWQSAYTYMLPIVKKYQIPVTLFVYPETISKGKHALTWEELKELQQTGLVDIQGHTFDHPNFNDIKKKLSPSSYEKYVQTQLEKSKKILEEKLNTKVSLLAWPFGIYDEYLEQAAAKAGYEMAFSIDARTANKSYQPMAQPRFMILASQPMERFIAIVNGAKVKAHGVRANKVK